MLKFEPLLPTRIVQYIAIIRTVAPEQTWVTWLVSVILSSDYLFLHICTYMYTYCIYVCTLYEKQ